MALSKKPYKGCRDFFPKDMRFQNYISDIMQRTCELFAYEPYDGPLLEEVKLYLAKSGEELIGEQIYDFTDKGNRHIAIRPEMTPTVARMAAQVHREVPKPIRWYSIANFMRYEKPQRGRLREFKQLNVDIFGAPDELAAFEIIDLICTLLQKFGANESMFGIQINDRRIVDAIFKNILNLDGEPAAKLYKVIDKSKKVNAEVVDKMTREIISDEDVITKFKSYLALTNFEELINFLKENNIEDSASDFITFYDKMKNTDINKFVNFDPAIVRGLDYYTGIVFEIFDKHPDNNRAVAGGGAYANLLQIFNEQPLAGIGFGFGDVPLYFFLESHNLLPDFSKADHDLMLAYFDEESESTALSLAKNLRAEGIKVDVALGKMKFNKVFKTADSRNHTYVALIGENERNDGVVQVKNTKTKDQENIKLENIKDIIKFIRN
jgi:histidyl-tRNA synthetase